MSTESNNNSRSPDLNDSQSTLNIRQRFFPSTSTSSNYPLGISFLSTSTPIKESEDMAYIEKRTAHNALERQRREGLNTKFQELAHVLPTLQQIRRPSKSMIVAKSLEFVSNAVERETDFQGQLHALRVENAQLLRQAKISNKRMRKQVESDNLSMTITSKKAGKQPAIITSPNLKASTCSLTTTTIKSASFIKSRRLSSKMKPQLRQTPQSISTEPPSSSPSSALNTIKTPLSLGVDTFFINNNLNANSEDIYQRKRSRDSSESSDQHNTVKESITTLPTSTTTILEVTSQLTPIQTANNIKRNSTTEIHTNSNNMPTNQVDYQSFLMDQHQQQIQVNQHCNRHSRYSSYQPSSSATQLLDDLKNIISPVVSRHNSITAVSEQLPLTFNNNSNDIVDNSNVAAIPSQFDMTTTSTLPFGNEQTFYNTYENFEHVVSTIPALRTPIGRNNSNQLQQPQPHPPYAPNNLDIFNLLLQDQISNSNYTNYYWQ